MKILFVANEIPYPPNNGVRIPIYNAMRLMHELGHDIALAVLTEETDNLENRLNVVGRMCSPGMTFCMRLPARNKIAVQLAALLCNRLYFVERFRCKQFKNSLLKLRQKFKPDVIHFDLITMAQYRHSVPNTIGTVASINDSYALTLKNSLDSGSYRGLEFLYRVFQFAQTKKYEKKTYPHFNSTHLMSKIDADYLTAINPKIKCEVIPNGAEPSLFDVPTFGEGKIDVIFVAKLVGENLLNLEKFILRTWKKVNKQCPSINFLIVGEVGREALDIKKRFHGMNNVFFKGYAVNLADAYKESGIAVVPINKNCGIINKAVEAMAAGHAVVGFEKSFSGIVEASPKVHFWTATSFEEMANVIITLVQNDRLRSATQLAAHQLAMQHYSWNSRARSYEGMYIDACTPHREHLKREENGFQT